MNGTQSTNPVLEYAEILWKPAGKLCDSTDVAECKHVVLALLFLNY